MANMIQHEPLRTPVGWNAGERAFIMQVERVLDDIYRNLTLLKSASGEPGPQGPPGPRGATGAAGYSPSVSVNKLGHTAIITITDRSGQTTVTLSDGADADPATIIDDTAGAGYNTKVWSADKVAREISTLTNAVNALGLSVVSGKLCVTYEEAGT